MTKSTEQCKTFIAAISYMIGASPQDKWKRTRKYKQDDLLLRDFSNADGRTIIIAEKGDNLFLYQLDKPASQSSSVLDGKKYIGKKATVKDLKEFIAQCVMQDPSIVYEDAFDDAIEASSWDNTYEGNAPEDCDDEFIADGEIALDIDDIKWVHEVFMPDYDTAYRITIYETKDKHLILGRNNPD